MDDQIFPTSFAGGDRQFLGRTSPGPGGYQPYKCTLAKKALFMKSTRPALSMPSDAPGPGRYDVRGMTNEAVKSKAAYNFGKPPPFARLNWARQGYETATWARLNMAQKIRNPQ